MQQFKIGDRIQRRYPNGDVVKGTVVNTSTEIAGTISVKWDNNTNNWPVYIVFPGEVELEIRENGC